MSAREARRKLLDLNFLTIRQIRTKAGEAFDLTDEVATHYAQIRADLKRRGAMIGANDT